MRVWMKRAGIMMIVGVIGCSQRVELQKGDQAYVESELKKLAPVTLTTDLSYLAAEEIQVIKLLVKAARHMDHIFLDQVYVDNPKILEELKRTANPENHVYLDMFEIMFGPWNRLDEHHPFINTLEKPACANFYPLDMTADEFNQWLADHPEDREAFEDEFTVIRRRGDGLVAVPYAEAYEKDLAAAAKYLNRAADLTSDNTLKTYLRNRADAFSSNDYYQSDMDWMDLAGDIEIVIGPYEVYEDGLFGYKAAFESFVCVVDHDESENLMAIAEQLNAMEDHLPIPDAHKNFDRGASSPIKVVNEIFTAGDTKAGVQTLAFNLPNDERVREAKGSKKVMLKNVMKAKFDKILTPIVERVIDDRDLARISFEGYFKHILLHEVSHGLGPGAITVDGRETTVNRELKTLYSVIEEAKADVLGVLETQFLIDQGVFSRELEKTLYASNLGGMFRSIRFGIDEAHGGGVAIQLNYYLDKGGVRVGRDGRFSVNDRRIKQAVRDLARDLLMIEAEGDFDAAQRMIDKYRVLRPEVEDALNKLTDIPVDIRPIYPILSEIE